MPAEGPADNDRDYSLSRRRQTERALAVADSSHVRTIMLPNLDSGWGRDFVQEDIPALISVLRAMEASASNAEWVKLDFRRVDSVSPATVVILAGAIRRFEHDVSRGAARLAVHTMSARVREVLGCTGLLKAFGHKGKPLPGRYLPLREDTRGDMNSIVEYVLRSSWMGSEWLAKDSDLQQEIVTAVTEIYINAFDHSESPIGVMACGEYDQTSQRLRLAIVDFGIGIPASVRRVIEPNMPTAQAIEWAFQRGNTTALTRFARGVGLEQLRRFVAHYRGELVVFSRDGKARFGAADASFVQDVPTFPGTLVTITLQRRARRYPIERTIPAAPWF